jgi:hypothetical protein
MKWIVIAIIVIVVPYTYVTLRYRKPGPAFRPYEDMKNRANVARLLAAGYQRMPIAAERPADRQRVRDGAEVRATAGGLPEALRSTLVEPPLLPGDIREVIAAPTANTLQPYSILLACTLPDDKQQLAGADLYVREDRLVFTPVFERVDGDLQTRSQEPVVLLTVPAGVLKPGRYEATVVGERSSRAWSLDVK